jgi:hypothetical protein
VNFDKTEPRMRMDHNRHVALEFKQPNGTSVFLAFEGSGLQWQRMSTSAFERQYHAALDRHPGAAALRLLDLNRSAYLPGDDVAITLLEIYMTKTHGTTDLNALDMKGLVQVYNDLAKTVGRVEVKAFKSKAEAIERIGKLGALVATPTTEQKENKAKAAEAAAKTAAKAAEKKPKAEKANGVAKPARKTAAEKLAGKAARVAGDPKPKSDKPKGQGIGSFCMELILKGKSNEDVLAAVAKQFEGAKTSAASIAWYRNKLKSEGQLKA